MKIIQLLLIAGVITILNGCKKESPTQPIDQNPTKIVLFQVNDATFQGSTGYVVTHIGDSVSYNIIAIDKDKLASYSLTWSNSSGRINIGAAYPLSDTMIIATKFLIDSTSYPFNAGYRPGSIVMHYITINDALGFQTHLEIQCIVSE
jgi:N-acetylmuramoyl-L-alanine amidase CwlA